MVLHCNFSGVFDLVEIQLVQLRGGGRRHGIPAYRDSFIEADKGAIGAVGDIGCYSLDLVLNALGHPKPLTVTGYTSNFLGSNPDYFTGEGKPAEYAEKFGVEDFAAGFIRLEGGIMLDFRISWAMHMDTCGDTLILGTKGGLAVSAKTKYPAEVCAWIDLFYNEDTTIDSTYGSEGSEWRVVDADGKISKLSGLTAEAEDELRNVKRDMPLRSMFTSLPYADTKNALENKIKTTAATQANRDLLQIYIDGGILNPDDEVWPRPYLSSENADEIGEIRGDIMLLVENYRAKAVTGQCNFTSDWDALQNDLKTKAQTERFVEILQETFDVFLAGSNKK